MDLSIIINDITFTILSKSEFLGRIIINLGSSLGKFSVYSSLSDGGSFKLCTFVTRGDFYKRDDSYIYGHNIHHQLTLFIYEKISDIPLSTTVLDNYCINLLKDDTDPGKYIYYIMSDENIPQHHIIFDVINNSIVAYKPDHIRSKGTIPEHLLFKKSNKTPFDELLYIIFKYYYDTAVDKNHYNVLSMTMSTYLNLFLSHINLNDFIKQSHKSKKAFIFKDGRTMIDEIEKSVTVVVDPYEMSEYKCFFKIPNHEELSKICVHCGIPNELIITKISEIDIHTKIEPVVIITQSYIYLITDSEKGNIIEENNISIPTMVLKSNYGISSAGTYTDYILCGGYIFKPFDYFGQLLDPSKFIFNVGSSKYGLVLNQLKNLWNPVID